MTMHEAAFSETALVSITMYETAGGTARHFISMTETIDIDIGDKDIDMKTNLKGGKLIQKIPPAMTTITFEGYPTEVGPAEDDDAVQQRGISSFFYTGSCAAGTAERNVEIARSRRLFRIALLWTDDTSATDASGSIAANSNFLRWVCVHAYMTGYKQTFTDGILKVTFTFKVAPFNLNGVAQIREDSAENYDGNALSTYSETNFDPDGASAYTWIGG